MENHWKSSKVNKFMRPLLPMVFAFVAVFISLWGMRGVSNVFADLVILYVDVVGGSDDSNCSNPSDPCASIGYALSYVESGYEIHVAQGIYQETIDIMESITLRGGYESAGWTRNITSFPTIIDGTGPDDAAIAIHPELTVVVEGFIIQGASHTSDQGGGVFIENAAVVISATVVRNNIAYSGGGINIGQQDEYPASLTLVNSSLLSNTAATDAGGGLHVSGWPEVILDNVEIRGNTAETGGGGIGGSRALLTNCKVLNNIAGTEGGGLGLARADIYDSAVSGNLALEGGGGGIAVRNGKLWLVNSLVTKNEASDGAAITGAGLVGGTIFDTRILENPQGGSAVSWYSSPFTMTNVLIADNDGFGFVSDEVGLNGSLTNVTIANNAYRGLQVTAEDIKVRNSILWGNGDLDHNCSGNCTITYSDIGTGDTTGVGNISQDPEFFKPSGRDYHLWASSPCVDSGTTAGAPPNDLEGTSRDLMPDMGAFEWTGFRLFLPITVRELAQ